MIDEIITGLAQHLPTEDLLRYDTELVPGEFLALANYVDEHGNKAQPGCFYKIKVPVIKANRHIHRARLAYLKGGHVELWNYLSKYFDKRRLDEMKREFIRLTVPGNENIHTDLIEEKLRAA